MDVLERLALKRKERDTRILQTCGMPKVWRKLKREDGQVVTGEREYKEPAPKGVCIGAVYPEVDEFSQVSVEFIARNGLVVARRVCYHGQDRRDAASEAIQWFNRG